MYYQEYQPSPLLVPYVQCYWIMRADANPFIGPERLIPDGTVELILNFGAPYYRFAPNSVARSPADSVVTVNGSHVVGPRSRGYLIEQTGNINHVAIRFKPGGLFALLDIPLSELTDHVVDLPLLLPTICTELESRIDAAPTDTARIKVLEQILLDSLSHPEAKQHIFGTAITQLQTDPGNIRIRTLAEQIGCNYKYLERLFLERAGITPKAYGRILRFLSVFDAIAANTALNWAEIASLCGYYDQAHLIKEFHAYTGTSPTGYFADRNAIAELLTRGSPDA